MRMDKKRLLILPSLKFAAQSLSVVETPMPCKSGTM
jgi:hypothetical protein